MGLSESERRAVKALADRLARQESVTKNLSRAQQIAHSTVTVPDGEGTTEMLVPEAVGRGVQAGFDAKAVDEKLDTARAELEQAQAVLDDKLADAELGLEGANQRLDDAETAIDDAFLGIDEAITLADQAKSNMPNRVDDPDFSFGDKHWQGTGGQFVSQGTESFFFIGARFDGSAITPVADTVDRTGTTAGAVAWATQGSTYELRFEGSVVAASITVTFGGNAPSQRMEKTITSTAELAEPIRFEWPTASGGPLKVRIQATTSGGATDYAYITAVSVTDVTTITEVKATADAALVSANGKQNIYYDSGDPSGTAPDGSVWYKVDTSGTVIQQWQYVDGAWVERPVSSEAIANLDVGKLTAGGAAIASLVAQEIASATAAFQRADIKNLFVTAGATINEAVIDKLWADVVVAKMLVADKIISSEAIVDELVGKVITAVTINGGTINGVSMVAGEFTTEADFDPDTTTYGVYVNSQKGMIVNGMQTYVVDGDDYDVPAQLQAQSAVAKFSIDAKQARQLAGENVSAAESYSQLSSDGLHIVDNARDSNDNVYDWSDVYMFRDRIDMRSNAGAAWLEPGMLRIGGGDGGRPGDNNRTFVYSDSVRFESYQQDERRLDASVDDRLALEAGSGRIDLDAGNGVYVNGKQIDADTGWVNVPLQSGYTGSCRYRVVGQAAEIRFDISGSMSGNTEITQALPSYIRPTGDPTVYSLSAYVNTSPANTFSQVYLDTSSGTLHAVGSPTRVRGGDMWFIG